MRALRDVVLPLCLASFATLLSPRAGVAAPEHDDPSGGLVDEPIDAPAVSGAKCRGGFAAGYPCAFVDLESFVPLHELGAGATDAASDLWGWRDPRGGREYALVGLSNGTSFVDVTNAKRPQVVAFLPTATHPSAWRELKVYANAAFIVSDNAGAHGLQIVKLERLRALARRVHDIQCEIYRGPDARFKGHEVCLASAADALWVLDVTDKANPTTLSRVTYEGRGYVHQGWLTEDHKTFLLDDELDERNAGGATRTYVWDVTDLTAIRLIAVHSAATPAIDHNQFVRGGLSFQANYRAGLRILDARRAGAGELTEMAFFDVAPASDDAGFGGAWGVYPFLASGNVLVSSIERGLFVVRPGPVLRKLAASKVQAGR
jgi:hypothetical protein